MHINGAAMADAESNSRSIYSSHIAEMLKQAGIGTGRTDPMYKPANAYINGETGQRPSNFLSGSVITTKKYERIQNRKIRKSNKRN